MSKARIVYSKEYTIAFLENYNKWRRGAEIEMPHPTEIGIAINSAIKYLKQDVKR
jgi:hypothetical protein